jgi:N-hydroxyarylamine O-acetyltransferase
MSGVATFDLAAYFGRIGYRGAPEPTAATLAQLIECHARHIPFENIDVLARRVPGLDLGSLQRKLVQQARGGYCYEQNSLFMAALTALGFEVRALEARVRIQAASGVITGRTHMALRVALGGSDHLVDVGFGGLAPLAPLRLFGTSSQASPGSLYRWVAVGAEWLLQIQGAQDWSDCYSVIDGELHAPDREIGNWYAATHPTFALAKNLSVACATEAGRLVLQNLRCTLRSHHAGLVQASDIGSVAELHDHLSDRFGLRLDPSDVNAAYAVACQASEREG